MAVSILRDAARRLGFPKIAGGSRKRLAVCAALGARVGRIIVTIPR
jgi:hypothetical protein